MEDVHSGVHSVCGSVQLMASLASAVPVLADGWSERVRSPLVSFPLDLSLLKIVVL